MSIADHFEHVPNTGFVRGYDSGSARRQFNVSLMLVVVIAVAASALGFLIRFDTPSRVGDMPAASQDVPAYAGKL